MAIDFIEEEYHSTEVFHDMINKVLELVALDKNSDIPHEWYFINVLIKEIERDNSLSENFAMYVAQYYKEYRWLNFNPKSYLESVILECGLQQFQFLQKCDLGEVDARFNDLSQAMAFGEIVTDFLIRYKNYSLIKSSGQKIIITSRSDCQKRFEELIYQDYCLQRKEKVVWTDISSLDVNLTFYPGVKGLFRRLPVLPTSSIDYPVDEIIEMPNGKYEKVFQLTLNK